MADKQGWGGMTLVEPPVAVEVDVPVDGVPATDVMTKYEHFKLSPTGLVALGKPSYEEWEALGLRLQMYEKGIAWLLGDWVNSGESWFGEQASQAIDSESGLAEATIRVYRWVAAKIPLGNRTTELSFGHHQEVAALEPSQQKVWLQKAIDGDDGVKWSTSRLKREIKNAEQGGDPLSASSAEYTVTVTCESEADQDALCRQLDNLGRQGKYHAKKPRA